MAMTEQEQKDLRSYCAFILKEYGFQISTSDPVIPALYIIHKEMQLNNKNNNVIASEVKAIGSQINPTVYHFNSPEAAFKFQLGIGIRWAVVGLLVVLIVWGGVWYWSLVNKVDEAGTIIESSAKVNELLTRVKKDSNGFYFLDFTLAKRDSIQHMREFIKLDAKTVRVYIGKEPN